jgi:outer membrane receptor protein involved in Fe transport
MTVRSARSKAIIAALLAVPPVADPTDAAPVEEVLVTGSRLPVAGVADGLPLAILDAGAVDRTGRNSVGQLLQQLPQNTGSPANANYNASGEAQGGDGATRVDLRGLGPERTLVLLDGRRLLAMGRGADDAVDLGMIPTNLISRVEILGAGNGTVFGSDAIAGVVNLVPVGLAPDIAGRGSLAATTHGDGEQWLAGLAAGWQFTSGALRAGIECYSHDPVWMSDRDYASQRELLAADGSAIAVGLAQTPSGFFRIPRSNALALVPGIYTRTGPAIIPVEASDFRRFVEPDDRYNPNEDEYLQTPLQRFTAWTLGEVAISDRVGASFQALLHHRDSRQKLRPAPIDTRFGIGIPELASGQPGIPADNFYNPFRVDLADVRRRVVEAGRRDLSQDVDATWLVAAVDGRNGAGVHWDTSLSWARNETTQRTDGELRADRLALALGPSGRNEAGRIVCGKPDPASGRVPSQTVIPGCVPLNLFGGTGPTGDGTITADQLDYVTADFRDVGRNEQWIADASLRSDFAALGAAQGDWAAGVQYRSVSGADQPDPAKSQGISGSTEGSIAAEGSYSAADAFVEAGVPLVVDAPWARRLDLYLGARSSHYSSFGWNAEGSGRLLWQPTAMIGLRAGYSGVYRAPPIGELYASDFAFLAQVTDPCGNQPTPVQAANCAANGVPGGSYAQDPFEEVPTTRGGNPVLRPERGRSWNAGITVTAPGRPWFLAIDYWDVRIGSALRQLRWDTIVDACADTGNAAVCQLVSRYPDGRLRHIDARVQNIGDESATGVDFGAGYNPGLSFASMTTHARATYLASRSIQASPGAEPIEVAGRKFERALYPRWRGTADVSVARGPWSGVLAMEYIGPVEECGTNPALLPGLMTGCREIASITYLDLSIRRELAHGLSIGLAVDNLADEDPPRVVFGFAEGNTSTLTYRTTGRTWFVELSYGRPAGSPRAD